MEILELRSYARTKAAIDRAERPEDVPDSPMVERVFEIVKEIGDQRRRQMAVDSDQSGPGS